MEIQNRIIRLPEVMQLTGLGRSSIYAYIQCKKFPPAIAIGARARGWKLDEIASWIEQRATSRGCK